MASRASRVTSIAPKSWGDARSLVESVSDYAIFMLDTEGYVRTWGPGAEKIKGYAAEEIIGRHFSVFYTTEDRASELPERILETVRLKGRYESEGWRERKDGSRFWANVAVSLVRDEHGATIGFAKVTRDLSARRLAEQELRESVEQSRLLLESLSEYALFMLDPDGLVTSWNIGAERLMGYEETEIVGKSFARFFLEKDVREGKPARALATALSVGRFEESGFRIRKNSTRFWANVVLTPIRNKQGKHVGFAEVTHDETARREAEAAKRKLADEQAARFAAEHAERRLRKKAEASRKAARSAEDALRRSEETNRIKDEFLATVSHELRTPLSAIVGWASLLRVRNRDAGLERGLETIHRNATAQARLIDDILDVSRVVTGKLALHLEAVDFGTIVAEAIDIVRPPAAAKMVTIEFERPADPMRLVGDHQRLRQVVWNLLSNAVKFTGSGGAVGVVLEQFGSNLLLSVRDTGQGIEPEFLPHVFERFRQADASTTRRFGGLGLGLAIVRHLVELHGGDARAESDGKGRGATFLVTLPVRATLPAFDVVADGAPRDSASDGDGPCREVRLDGLRVLVVDDDADTRELLENVLQEAGALVESAESAPTALEGVRSFRPDVLVSDIGMAGEDGYSLVQAVGRLPQSDGGNVRAIALSAYVRDVDRERAMAAGFVRHLGKPVDIEQLIHAVAEVAHETQGTKAK